MSLDNILGSIATRAGSVPALGNSLKIDLGSRKIYIDGTGETNVVSDEDKEADCTVSVSEENFIALVSGDLNPMSAMMTGKVKISGNMGVAMKLQSLIGG